MIFVTGMLRSGTTLLDKLLSAHPDVSLLSQPFPFVFLDAKRAFLRPFGSGDDAYPLGDLFLETRYGLGDFSRFLAGYRPAPEDLRSAFARMSTYSGQCTRFTPDAIDDALARLAPADFAGTLAQLYRQLGHRKSATWVGGKETLCEEFLPYLLDASAVCALIVRDPRDVLASLNHGRGEVFGGRRKPTLFNLRQWRKNAAFALHLQPHPRFAWLRYEDLVADPSRSLARLTGILGLGPLRDDLFDADLRDQSGEVWAGNSSHHTARRLDASSVGAYARSLPTEVIAFAEAACYPEMKALGYPVSINHSEALTILERFVDPYEDVREHLREIYASPERAAEEIARLHALDVPAAHYFLSPGVGAALRSAVDT